MALTTSGTEVPFIRQLFSRRAYHLGVTDATICDENDTAATLTLKSVRR
jgi:hypothetical protein